MIVKANRGERQFVDVDEAEAIVWATDLGARIINLSLGGGGTSVVERKAVDYAVSHGVLLVASAGNMHAEGDPVQYPAALLQPPGSNGAPARGLSVGASDSAGARASFSTANSTVSLAAPGANVLGAVARTSVLSFQRITLPGSSTGVYGYGSGSSYASPQVAGAAALVWAANPHLTAAQVADVLRRSASGNGAWNADLGYGILDVARAVALAGTTPAAAGQGLRLDGRREGNRLLLSWWGAGAAPLRLTVSTDGGEARVVPTSGSSASYEIASGHSYAFAVDVLDAQGTVVSSSAPYRIAVQRPLLKRSHAPLNPRHH
jgi:subtilisin family serine protease